MESIGKAFNIKNKVINLLGVVAVLEVVDVVRSEEDLDLMSSSLNKNVFKRRGAVGKCI